MAGGRWGTLPYEEFHKPKFLEPGGGDPDSPIGPMTDEEIKQFVAQWGPFSVSEIWQRMTAAERRVRELELALRSVSTSAEPIPIGLLECRDLRIAELEVELATLKITSEKDYQAMRSFQAQFIDADHDRRRLAREVEALLKEYE